MIITKIIGGLGNQLFQYAAGKALAVYHKTTLKLDLSGFDEYRLRNFDLTAFNTEYELAKKNEILQHSQSSFFKKIRNRIASPSQTHYYRERHFHYDKNFLLHPYDAYMKGYWQSEKYFKNIEGIIRKEFSFKENFIKNVIGEGKEITKKQSIAVHIRRGDYANNGAIRMHGVLGKEYYEAAISIMKKSISNAEFYIFSDSMQWVNENISIPNAISVSGNLTRTHFEDLYLMSQCRHNIIANSSFSWWGAWLNNNPNKIVIAPKKWFNKGPKDTQDLIPKEWLKI